MRPPEALPDPSDQGTQQEVQAELQRALGGLPAREREAFVQLHAAPARKLSSM